jgi:hypothetical protein
MNSKPDRKKIRGYATVGDLKKFIKQHKIPNNALILYQRIEDVYFKKYGWNKSICTVKKPDFELEGTMDTYVTVWAPVKFKDDSNLYLTAHY